MTITQEQYQQILDNASAKGISSNAIDSELQKRGYSLPDRNPITQDQYGQIQSKLGGMGYDQTGIEDALHQKGYQVPNYDPYANFASSRYSPSETLLSRVGTGLSNIPSSLGNLIGGIGESLAHPIKTAAGMGELISGAASEAVGYKAQANTFLGESQQTFNYFADYMKARYGSPENIIRTLEEDPAGAALDISMIWGWAGEVMRIARTAEEASVAAEAVSEAQKIREATTGRFSGIRGATKEFYHLPTAEKLSRAGDVINPFNVALRGGGIILKGGSHFLQILSGQDANTVQAYQKYQEFAKQMGSETEMGTEFGKSGEKQIPAYAINPNPLARFITSMALKGVKGEVALTKVNQFLDSIYKVDSDVKAGLSKMFNLQPGETWSGKLNDVMRSFKSTTKDAEANWSKTANEILTTNPDVAGAAGSLDNVKQTLSSIIGEQKKLNPAGAKPYEELYKTLFSGGQLSKEEFISNFLEDAGANTPAKVKNLTPVAESEYAKLSSQAGSAQPWNIGQIGKHMTKTMDDVLPSNNPLDQQRYATIKNAFWDDIGKSVRATGKNDVADAFDATRMERRRVFDMKQSHFADAVLNSNTPQVLINTIQKYTPEQIANLKSALGDDNFETVKNGVVLSLFDSASDEVLSPTDNVSRSFVNAEKLVRNYSKIEKANPGFFENLLGKDSVQFKTLQKVIQNAPDIERISKSVSGLEKVISGSQTGFILHYFNIMKEAMKTLAIPLSAIGYAAGLIPGANVVPTILGLASPIIGDIGAAKFVASDWGNRFLSVGLGGQAKVFSDTMRNLSYGNAMRVGSAVGNVMNTSNQSRQYRP